MSIRIRSHRKQRPKRLRSRKHHGSPAGAAAPVPGTCSRCGCTDDNCQQCFKVLGHPCSWANRERTICTRCAP